MSSNSFRPQAQESSFNLTNYQFDVIDIKKKNARDLFNLSSQKLTFPSIKNSEIKLTPEVFKDELTNCAAIDVISKVDSKTEKINQGNEKVKNNSPAGLKANTTGFISATYNVDNTNSDKVNNSLTPRNTINSIPLCQITSSQNNFQFFDHKDSQNNYCNDDSSESQNDFEKDSLMILNLTKPSSKTNQSSIINQNDKKNKEIESGVQQFNLSSSECSVQQFVRDPIETNSEQPKIVAKKEKITKDQLRQKDIVYELVMNKLQKKKFLNAEKHLHQSKHSLPKMRRTEEIQSEDQQKNKIKYKNESRKQFKYIPFDLAKFEQDQTNCREVNTKNRNSELITSKSVGDIQLSNNLELNPSMQNNFNSDSELYKMAFLYESKSTAQNTPFLFQKRRKNYNHSTSEIKEVNNAEVYLQTKDKPVNEAQVIKRTLACVKKM